MFQTKEIRPNVLNFVLNTIPAIQPAILHAGEKLINY